MSDKDMPDGINMISKMRKVVKSNGIVSLTPDEFDQLQAEWITRVGADEIIDELNAKHEAELKALANKCGNIYAEHHIVKSQDMGYSIPCHKAILNAKVNDDDLIEKHDEQLNYKQSEVDYLDAKITSAMCCHPNAVQTLLLEASCRTHFKIKADDPTYDIAKVALNAKDGE